MTARNRELLGDTQHPATTEDIALLAYCFGAALKTNLPLLRVLKVVEKVTQNAQLKQLVIHEIEEIECGNYFDPTIGEFFNFPNILTEEFIRCLYGEDPDATYEDFLARAPSRLLQFASDKVGNAALVFAHQVGRPSHIQELVNFLSTHTHAESFRETLKQTACQGSLELKALVARLLDKLDINPSVSGAFFPLYRIGKVDALFINLVDVGEVEDTLPLSFRLLSTSDPKVIMGNRK